MLVKFTKEDPRAEIPTKATDGSACYDVKCVEAFSLAQFEVKAISTGLKVEIPKGWELQVRSRSGYALKNKVFVLNSPGCVDADFRGVVRVILMNIGEQIVDAAAGSRIAQLKLSPAPEIEFVEVAELSDTSRGEGGFGSTGAK